MTENRVEFSTLISKFFDHPNIESRGYEESLDALSKACLDKHSCGVIPDVEVEAIAIACSTFESIDDYGLKDLQVARMDRSDMVYDLVAKIFDKSSGDVDLVSSFVTSFLFKLVENDQIYLADLLASQLMKEESLPLNVKNRIFFSAKLGLMWNANILRKVFPESYLESESVSLYKREKDSQRMMQSMFCFINKGKLEGYLLKSSTITSFDFKYAFKKMFGVDYVWEEDRGKL